MGPHWLCLASHREHDCWQAGRRNDRPNRSMALFCLTATASALLCVRRRARRRIGKIGEDHLGRCLKSLATSEPLEGNLFVTLLLGSHCGHVVRVRPLDQPIGGASRGGRPTWCASRSQSYRSAGCGWLARRDAGGCYILRGSQNTCENLCNLGVGDGLGAVVFQIEVHPTTRSGSLSSSAFPLAPLLIDPSALPAERRVRESPLLSPRPASERSALPSPLPLICAEGTSSLESTGEVADVTIPTPRAL
eukprot:scaffold206925_cov33-Tisochrysis_lutea.AAC.1